MIRTLLRFADLKARGIVNNWVTLRDWIEREGFPAGTLLGPNTRVWPEQEIADWIASRPTAPKLIPITENHVSRRSRKTAEASA